MLSLFCVYRWSTALVAGALGLSGAADAGAPVTPASAAWCAPRCDQLVIDWNQTAHQVFAAENGHADPLGASRTLAMMHLAMHDAVNATQPRYASYALQERASDADAAVAAVTAAHDVLLALHPKQAGLLKAQLQSALQEAGKGSAVESGKALGARAAKAILARRAADGSTASESYTPGIRAGEYRYTPGFEFIALPHWRKLQPFALRDPAQFRVAAPPALDSAAYTRAFDEVSVWAAPKARNARPTRRSTPRSGTSSRNRLEPRRARGLAPEADDLCRARAPVRPGQRRARRQLHRRLGLEDALQRLAPGHGDPACGNRRQPRDATRRHVVAMLPTPPIRIIRRRTARSAQRRQQCWRGCSVVTTMAFAFTSTSADAASPARSFASFWDAARENADSRVMAGLHFRFATDAGLQLGRPGRWRRGHADPAATRQFGRPRPGGERHTRASNAY